MFRSIGHRVGKRGMDIISKSDQLNKAKLTVLEFMKEIGSDAGDLIIRVERKNLIIGSKNRSLINEISLRRASLGLRIKSLGLNLKLDVRG